MGDTSQRPTPPTDASPRATSMLGLRPEDAPRALGTASRPFAAPLGALLTVGHLIVGLSPFVSPGQDAFQGMGYVFGAIALALAVLSAIGTVIAIRGDATAWLALILPLAAMGLVIVTLLS